MVASETESPSIAFLILIIFSCADFCLSDNAVRHCVSGTDSDLIGLRNLNCQTNQSSLLNSVARKTQSSTNKDSKEASNGTAGPVVSYCMVFNYFDESVTNDGHEDSTQRTMQAIYTCDFNGLCDSKSMEETYEVTYQGKTGSLVCCDTNNCNTHSNRYLHEDLPHKRSCYIGEYVYGHSPKMNVQLVEHSNLACVKITEKRPDIKHRTVVPYRETYSIDQQECVRHNLTGTNKHACRVIMKNATLGIEEEICCCYGDEEEVCKPEWLASGEALDVAKETKHGRDWHIAFYVCVGIAVTVLVVTASVCVYRRLSKGKGYAGQSKTFSKMAYRSVSEDGQEGERDNVQILTVVNYQSGYEEEV